MLFMVIEHFKDADPKPIYRRLRDEGRTLPEGLRYVNSWVEVTWQRCFQVMECDDARLLQQWITRWNDIGRFEVLPVVTSAEAQATIAPLL
ncbi:MAG TPA: DUF3303 family protein [bacterium]|nr:DUF3303 family protein [bacterium]